MACIKNNGHLSGTFPITRGIRQGCPVSSLLFILAVEILATKVRNCESLKGYDFGTNLKRIKLSQYADDATIFLNSKTEMCSAISILTEFGSLAGTKLNVGKCEGLWKT